MASSFSPSPNEPVLSFSDAELLAWVDETLALETSARLEAQLRQGPSELLSRVQRLLANREQTGRTVGEIWQRVRASCPPRALWQAFLAGELGDTVQEYLRLHRDVIGCRYCQANCEDLQRSDGLAEEFRRKVFETSVGHLRRPD